jgi:methionyl aminopeptidase
MIAPNFPVRKSPEEIAFYQEHCSIFNRTVLEPLRTAVYTGQRVDLEKEFMSLCEPLRASHGTLGFPFQLQRNHIGEIFGHSICVSVNGTVAHCKPTIPLKPGDIVSVDCGIALPFSKRTKTKPSRDLCFDAAFTMIYDGARLPKQEWINAPLHALAAIEKKQPADTMEIARIIQKVSQTWDLQQVVSLTGHGIGYTLHEAPAIHNSPGQFVATDLFEGLVFCAEPIFVNPGYNRTRAPIAPTCLEADGWSVATISGAPATHFETMFGVVNGQVIDLIGVSKWKL